MMTAILKQGEDQDALKEGVLPARVTVQIACEYEQRQGLLNSDASNQLNVSGHRYARLQLK
ncbi:MAG: hypothetical protein JKY01_02785 [Pseudomonadales bacterium]|nr:hypothetical protein [Pseudomonadales bacterium]